MAIVPPRRAITNLNDPAITRRSTIPRASGLFFGKSRSILAQPGPPGMIQPLFGSA
jgi:hypothetical protein